MKGQMILGGAIAAFLSGAAGAAELQYGFEAGVGTSDNIARVPANGESETILTAGVDLRLLREGSLVNADVNLDLTYFDYRDGTYDGELLGTGEANIGLAFIPERFVWIVQDSFGQLQLDGDMVMQFDEKPDMGEGWINGGFFVLEPEIFRYIPGDVDWAREPMEKLASDGQLVAFRHEGFWQCMDTMRDKVLLSSIWDSGAAPWRVWA